MAIYSAGGKLLLSDDGKSLRGCCCCDYMSCASAESHPASTVEWCATTIGCAQSFPHVVYINYSFSGGLFLPSESYFDCSGSSHVEMDESSRCCEDGRARYPVANQSGTNILTGATSGHYNTRSLSWSVTTSTAHAIISAGSNFGEGATSCSCNDTPGCSPKGKYGYVLTINATNHAVKVWDLSSNCRTSRSPDWTIAKGGRKSFGTTCDQNSGDMRLWDSVKRINIAMNFEG